MKFNGKSLYAQLEVKGEITGGGNLTDEEIAEINAELDELLQETNADMIEVVNKMTIAEKIRFAQTGRGFIENSIEDKGVTVPSPYPFRSLAGLIDQIEVGGGNVVSVKNIMQSVTVCTESISASVV